MNAERYGNLPDQFGSEDYQISKAPWPPSVLEVIEADREDAMLEQEFIGWWDNLDEDDKHMLLSLAIYMALGGKLNAFNVQETGVDINGV